MSFLWNKYMEWGWLYNIVNILKTSKVFSNGGDAVGCFDGGQSQMDLGGNVLELLSPLYIEIHEKPENRVSQPWEGTCRTRPEVELWMCPRAGHKPQPHPYANKVKDEWEESKSRHCLPFFIFPKLLTLAAVGKSTCFHGIEKEGLNWIITTNWKWKSTNLITESAWEIFEICPRCDSVILFTGSGDVT